MNNLYGWATSQDLPTKTFCWLTQEKIAALSIYSMMRQTTGTFSKLIWTISKQLVLFLTQLLSMISLNLTKVSFFRLTRYFLIFCQKKSLKLQVSSDIALCMFLVNIFVVISLERRVKKVRLIH